MDRRDRQYVLYPFSLYRRLRVLRKNHCQSLLEDDSIAYGKYLIIFAFKFKSNYAQDQFTSYVLPKNDIDEAGNFQQKINQKSVIYLFIYCFKSKFFTIL